MGEWMNALANASWKKAGLKLFSVVLSLLSRRKCLKTKSVPKCQNGGFLYLGERRGSDTQSPLPSRWPLPDIPGPGPEAYLHLVRLTQRAWGMWPTSRTWPSMRAGWACQRNRRDTLPAGLPVSTVAGTCPGQTQGPVHSKCPATSIFLLFFAYWVSSPPTARHSPFSCHWSLCPYTCNPKASSVNLRKQWGNLGSLQRAILPLKYLWFCPELEAVVGRNFLEIMRFKYNYIRH